MYLYWVDNEVGLLTSLMQCLLQVGLGHIFKGYTHKDVSHQRIESLAVSKSEFGQSVESQGLHYQASLLVHSHCREGGEVTAQGIEVN